MYMHTSIRLYMYYVVESLVCQKTLQMATSQSSTLCQVEEEAARQFRALRRPYAFDHIFRCGCRWNPERQPAKGSHERFAFQVQELCSDGYFGWLWGAGPAIAGCAHPPDLDLWYGPLGGLSNVCTSSETLVVTTSVLVTTSKALVTRSKALVPSSFLFLI